MPARLLQPRYLAGAAVALVVGILLFRAPWAAGLSGSAAPADSTFAMNCEPHQRALVRQATVSGRAQITVACETAPTAVRIVRTSTTATRSTAATSTRRAEPARSWKKTALVIGGSTGAGAGIGAAIGGKKGALIGAAIGGGASALYEAIKRR